MTYAIGILTAQVTEIEGVRQWTQDCLSSEDVKLNRDRLQKYILDYDAQIAELRLAISILEKTV